MLDLENNTLEFESEMVYKIYNSQINRYPFAHGQIENFLPEDLIATILNYWPNPEEFNSNLKSASIKNINKTEEHAYNFRHQIALTQKEEIEQIKGDRLEVWKYFSRLLCSKRIMNSFIALYAASLMKRFQFKNPADLYTNIEYRPRLHLIHDKTNYALGPHTDNSEKVIVILIYFESDNDSKGKNHFGTSVYIPKEQGFKCSTGEHHEHSKFIKVFSADFKKNNSFSFCRSDESFHGVEKVQEKSVERKLLQYSLYGKRK